MPNYNTLLPSEYKIQWRSQGIDDARAQHGQSAEALEDLGHAVLENVWDFTTSQVNSEAISSMGERTIYISTPCFSMVCTQFGSRFAMDNNTISANNSLAYTCTGGARPLVARAVPQCAPAWLHATDKIQSNVCRPLLRQAATVREEIYSISNCSHIVCKSTVLAVSLPKPYCLLHPCCYSSQHSTTCSDNAILH